MSCHSIGRGMASVAKVVLNEYDSGHIPYESAFRLLMACRDGVNWCDGNEYEATSDFEDRCGLCLRKGLELHELPWREWDHKKSIHNNLCSDCLDAARAVQTNR